MNVLLWDFDGTLGYRDSGFAHIIRDLLQTDYPDLTLDDVRAQMGSGFFWQEHDQPHTHLHTAADWWAEVTELLTQVMMNLDVERAKAEAAATDFRAVVTDLNTWHRFEDTVPTLKALSEQGWRHLVVSNHIPELDTIIEHLGLMPLLDHVINSATVGYEKPHPQIFKIALDKVPAPDRLWMIGDNYHADVIGAQALNIPAILVRKTPFKDEASFFADNLSQVIDIIEEN